MKSLFSRVVGYLSVDHPSAGLKQLPTAVVFLISVITVLSIPGVDVTNATFAYAGIGGMVLATAFSAFVSRLDHLHRWAIIIPVIDLFAIGAFRTGTGAAASLFSAMIILPVVWIASERGRIHILIATLGTSVALLTPFLSGVGHPTSISDVFRGTFTPLVFGIAAAIINELARQSRVQLAAIREISEQNEQILERAVQYALQIKQSEAKYRDYQRMFRGVWAAVTEQSVIGTDVTGLIDAWNPGAEKILGISALEAEDKRYVFEFHRGDELDARARELNYPPGATVLNPGFSALVESARTGSAESREWTYVRADGSQVPVELSVTKRVDEDGAISGYLFVATDETRNREVAKLKDEFVGLISHELRTPLSSILGYLELMKDDEDHPLSDEQLQYLSVAERNAHRLLRLVGDLLFTAQVESSKFPLDARILTLDGIVRSSVESARPVAASAGITLVEQIDPQPLSVNGDPLRLGQACDNLISNAIKFTPRGGTVTVSLDAVDGRAVIAVQDTGMGIAASELDQLFSRFFRASTATRNAVPGVGLGLTITKAIVTAHQGEMSVASEEGVGTRFSMTLPFADISPVTPVAITAGAGPV
ncbi:MAG: hypothetical protein JWQ12_1625 [Glaciihabitans sp.]|nr:hypothetical protein [Glaciihabitans sp.]